MKLVDAYGRSIKIGDIVRLLAKKPRDTYKVAGFDGVRVQLCNTDKRQYWDTPQRQPKNLVKLEIEDLI